MSAYHFFLFPNCQSELVNDVYELPADEQVYVFDDLHVGYEYTFTIAAVNNIGEGEPLGLGDFITCKETGKFITCRETAQFQVDIWALHTGTETGLDPDPQDPDPPSTMQCA